MPINRRHRPASQPHSLSHPHARARSPVEPSVHRLRELHRRTDPYRPATTTRNTVQTGAGTAVEPLGVLTLRRGLSRPHPVPVRNCTNVNVNVNNSDHSHSIFGDGGRARARAERLLLPANDRGAFSDLALGKFDADELSTQCSGGCRDSRGAPETTPETGPWSGVQSPRGAASSRSCSRSHRHVLRRIFGLRGPTYLLALDAAV